MPRAPAPSRSAFLRPPLLAGLEKVREPAARIQVLAQTSAYQLREGLARPDAPAARAALGATERRG